MKRNTGLTIFLLFVVLCLCFSFVACEMINNNNGNNNTDDGDDNGDVYSDLNMRGEVNELLTAQELVDFHLNGAKYPDNFVFDELTDYGRVIASSSSQEEALSTATEHFNSGWCTTVECRLTVETDLFYGLYVKWDYRNGGVGEPVAYYDEYVVSFKKSVFNYYFSYDESDYFGTFKHNLQFFTQDKGAIKSILDYYLYSWTYQIYGEKVYSTDINLQGDKYVYTGIYFKYVWAIGERKIN